MPAAMARSFLAKVDPWTTARRRGLLERGEVVKGEGCAPGQQRLETATEVGVVGERKRAIGQAMIGMAAVDDARPAGGVAGELDRGLDTLGARIGEKYLV